MDSKPQVVIEGLEIYHMSDEQIHARYQEICLALEIAPPKFEIKPVTEMQDRDGLHLRHGGNLCSVYLSKAVRIPEVVDAILIHELAHHVLYLAGYSSPGHAWAMLSTEQILFWKAGIDTDSIYWDAQNNWPKHIFWGVWVRHVQYAYELSGSEEVTATVMQMNSREIARWVLEHPPAFEQRLWGKTVGRSILEMYHTLIADLRSARIFSTWMVRILVFGVTALFAIANTLHSEWLRQASAGLLFWGIFGLLLIAAILQAFRKVVSVSKSAIGVVSKMTSALRLKK